MWYLQKCERALYLPPIFSWLAALATLSLLRDFSSGSAIFPLSLGPLVLSFSSCPPLPSSLYVPFLLLSEFPPISLSHMHTHARMQPPTPQLSNPPWFVHSHTHAHTLSPSFAHTVVVTQTSSDPDPLTASPSPPSPQDTAGRSWTIMMLLLREPTPTPNEWWDISKGEVGCRQAPFAGAPMWRYNLFVYCLIQLAYSVPVSVCNLVIVY